MDDERKIEPLKRDGLQMSEHAFTRFSCRVPVNTPPEDLTDPEFWVHVMPKLKIGDEIRVIAADFSYRIELIVTFTNGKTVRLKMLTAIQLEDVKPDITTAQKKDYKLEVRGEKMWCVQRLSDGEFVQENIPTKPEAVTWLEMYVKSLNGDQDAIQWLEDHGSN